MSILSDIADAIMTAFIDALEWLLTKALELLASFLPAAIDISDITDALASFSTMVAPYFVFINYFFPVNFFLVAIGMLFTVKLFLMPLMMYLLARRLTV